MIFAGPSLPLPRPTRRGLSYARPARRGDLLDTAKTRVAIIGLIDGVFHQDLAVSPGEVRAAAATGARIFGGASLGALRACECPDVMTGVGAIWQRFTTGELTDDDEVAVTYWPDTYEIIAYPLVQIREVARLAAAHLPSATDALRRFVEAARTLPFHERTLDRLRAAAATLGLPWSELEARFADHAADLKRQDALAVVDAVSEALRR